MQINYQASKTGAAFHLSNKLIRCIKGPVGSGKTVVCLLELFKLAQQQYANAKGMRLTRWVIIRNTSIELETTTLNTFKQWFPPPISSITLRPYIKATIEFPLADQTTVHTEFYFLALDRDDDVRKLLSLEVSGGFMNETRELGYAALKALRERTGRYPAQIDGYQDTPTYKAPRDKNGHYQPLRQKAIVCDTNPSDTDHWWYQLAVNGCLHKEENKEFAKREVKRLFQFFDCPPPLFKHNGEYIINKDADNIQYLPGGHQYYLDMLGGNTSDHINVMVLGNYGVIKDGKAVYPEFNDAYHVVNGLKASKEFPICLGWDFGLTPAVTIGQMNDRGAVRIVAELVTEDMHVRQFARDVVKPFLQRYFPNIPIGFSMADPAGNNRGEGEGKTSIGILNDDYVSEFDDEPLEMGFTTDPAPTNDPDKRLDAVKSYLIRMIDGEPAFRVNGEMCPTLVKGFQGMYRYKKIQATGRSEVYSVKPLKDKWSHCFVSDTKIQTSKGTKAISKIKKGNYVKTHLGYKRVLQTMHQHTFELCKLTLNNGQIIICTPNHPFFTIENGIVRADALQYLTLVCVNNLDAAWVRLQNIKYKNSMASNTTKNLMAIINQVEKKAVIITCIVMFGNFITEKLKTGLLFITKIMIKPITELKIYNYYHRVFTRHCTESCVCKKVQKKQKNIWQRCKKKLNYGMHHSRVWRGIKNMAKNHGLTKQKLKTLAVNAKRFMRFTNPTLSDHFVAHHAKTEQEYYQGLTTKKENAKCAVKNLCITNTSRKNTVLKVVSVSLFQSEEKTAVYDLHVEDAHTFYANGALVHNCQDSAQYLMLGFKGGYNPVIDDDKMYLEDDSKDIAKDFW